MNKAAQQDQDIASLMKLVDFVGEVQGKVNKNPCLDNLKIARLAIGKIWIEIDQINKTALTESSAKLVLGLVRRLIKNPQVSIFDMDRVSDALADLTQTKGQLSQKLLLLDEALKSGVVKDILGHTKEALDLTRRYLNGHIVNRRSVAVAAGLVLVN